MRFHIASRIYALQIAAGPLAKDGTACLAACAQDERLILIAADCPPRERLRVLLREILRAWTFETASPTTFEGWLDLAATMCAAVANDLNAHGGEMALINLRPGESPEIGAARAGLGTSRQCAVCRGTVAGGSVIWKPGVLPGVAELRMYCDFCGHTQIWTEAQNAKGVPNCICLSEPTFISGDVTGSTLTAAG